MIRITTRDVGLTQVATVWVGETRAIEFYTGTKHKDYSLEIAEATVASALAHLIRGRQVREWSGEPGGSHDAF